MTWVIRITDQTGKKEAIKTSNNNGNGRGGKEPRPNRCLGVSWWFAAAAPDLLPSFDAWFDASDASFKQEPVLFTSFYRAGRTYGWSLQD